MNENNEEKRKIYVPSFSIIGADNVAKFIEALSEKNGFYEFRVWTDEYQSYLDANERSYTIEVADRKNGQCFIFDAEENWE